ncbi:hypothetical protein [Chroococcidiopsis sp.]|uniref:hypothetical protein n=1 Tax=Chroococcidiopsis sp. TaxID=3088168 RepID=UPI003F4084D7
MRFNLILCVGISPLRHCVGDKSAPSRDSFGYIHSALNLANGYIESSSVLAQVAIAIALNEGAGSREQRERRELGKLGEKEI